MSRISWPVLLVSLCFAVSGCGNPFPFSPPSPPDNPPYQPPHTPPYHDPNPRFLIYPKDRTVRVGQPTTFTTEVVGDGPIQYQWYRNGTPIKGAQGPEYTLALVTQQDDGTIFMVAASNPYSTVRVSATLHVRIPLSELPVAGIAISLPDGPALLPGQTLPLVVSATEQDGQVLVTEGRGRGKISWEDLALQATYATVNAIGQVSLPDDPRATDGVVPGVQATVVGRADLSATLNIPVRYDGAFHGDFPGAPGASGSDGWDGLAGMDGSSGSCDPDFPQAGGDGTSGWSGGNGSDGGPGASGPDLLAWVRLRPGAVPLLEVKVTAQGQDHYFLVDPAGGTLTLNADGGPGGSGGRGGRGGAGGSGGYGCPSGMSGTSGMDGLSGGDGPGGPGGTITVRVDAAAVPNLSVLKFSNKGGTPGGSDGPSPTILVEAVGPLW